MMMNLCAPLMSIFISNMVSQIACRLDPVPQDGQFINPQDLTTMCSIYTVKHLPFTTMYFIFCMCPTHITQMLLIFHQCILHWLFLYIFSCFVLVLFGVQAFFQSILEFSEFLEFLECVEFLFRVAFKVWEECIVVLLANHELNCFFIHWYIIPELDTRTGNKAWRKPSVLSCSDLLNP